jgi:hypothetical protein
VHSLASARHVFRSHSAISKKAAIIKEWFSEPQMLDRAKEIAGLVRDIGLILGVPSIIVVGMSIYDLQSKANEAQVNALEAEISGLKETQYDRAAALIKGQKDVYEADRARLDQQITQLKEDLARNNQKIAQVAGAQKLIQDCLSAVINQLAPVIGGLSKSGGGSAYHSRHSRSDMWNGQEQSSISVKGGAGHPSQMSEEVEVGCRGFRLISASELNAALRNNGLDPPSDPTSVVLRNLVAGSRRNARSTVKARRLWC